MEQQKLNLKNYSFREALQEWDWTKNVQNVLQNYTTVAVGRNALPICLKYSNHNHASLTCDVQTRLSVLVVTLQRLCRQSKVKWKLEASISQTLRSSIVKPVSLVQLALLGKLIYRFFFFLPRNLIYGGFKTQKNIWSIYFASVHKMRPLRRSMCQRFKASSTYQTTTCMLLLTISHTVWESGARVG